MRPQAQPTLTEQAMAAATMAEHGRLFEFPDTEKFSREISSTMKRQREREQRDK